METRKMTINIPIDIHKKLKTIAVFRDISMTDIIMEKIKEVIQEEESQEVEKKQSK